VEHNKHAGYELVVFRVGKPLTSFVYSAAGMRSEQSSQSSPSHESFAEARNRLQFCVERGRLVDDLNRATRDYAKAVHDLTARVEILSAAGYVRLRVTVDQARADAKHCREALHQHQREHGC
jgi:hypothetical protein